MIATLLLASIPLVLQDPSAPIPTAPIAAVASPAPFDVAVLPGSTVAPDCGGRAALAALAFCVSTPSGTQDAVGTAYLIDLEGKGWTATSADGARLLLVRRRNEGGCDGLQILGLDPASEGPAYLAFGAIPVDVCASASATPGLPAPGDSQ